MSHFDTIKEILLYHSMCRFICRFFNEKTPFEHHFRIKNEKNSSHTEQTFNLFTLNWLKTANDKALL